MNLRWGEIPSSPDFSADKNRKEKKKEKVSVPRKGVSS